MPTPGRPGKLWSTALKQSTKRRDKALASTVRRSTAGALADVKKGLHSCRRPQGSGSASTTPNADDDEELPLGPLMSTSNRSSAAVAHEVSKSVQSARTRFQRPRGPQMTHPATFKAAP